MSDDLTSRLLAEIERREGAARDALGPDDLGHPRSYYSTHGPTQDDWNLWVYAVPIDVVLAYLGALRAVVELHVDAGYSQGYVDNPGRTYGPGYGESGHCCRTCGALGEYGIRWPCSTLRAVASALGVSV